MYSVIGTGLRPSNARVNKEWSVRVNREKPGSFKRFPDTDFPMFLHELEFFDSTTETEISGRASRYLTKNRSPQCPLIHCWVNVRFGSMPKFRAEAYLNGPQLSGILIYEGQDSGLCYRAISEWIHHYRQQNLPVTAGA